jgi:imidazolonepropionase-like amidohydrolase
MAAKRAAVAAPAPAPEIPRPERRAAGSTIITNVQVFNGNGLSPPGAVFIQNGVIVQALTAPPTATVDGQGGVLLPGLIDSHVHVDNMADLNALSSYGVTTGMTMACMNYTVCNSLRNQPGLSSFYTAGELATTPGSAHANLFQIPPGLLVSSPAQADQFAAWTFGNGSDYLKIIAEANGLDQPTQNALVAAAHSRGKQSMTHAVGLTYYQQAIASNTDGIQHTPGDAQLPAANIQQMVSQKQYVTPTLEIARIALAAEAKNPALGPVLGGGTYAQWVSNVQAMHHGGVPILAGTDAAGVIGQLVGMPNENFFGWTLHEELTNLVGAGFTPIQALNAATTVPAMYHGLSDRGRIANGMRADLVLLQPGANPTTNINDTRKLSKVWIGGIQYANVNTDLSSYLNF